MKLPSLPFCLLPLCHPNSHTPMYSMGVKFPSLSTCGTPRLAFRPLSSRRSNSHSHLLPALLHNSVSSRELKSPIVKQIPGSTSLAFCTIRFPFTVHEKNRAGHHLRTLWARLGTWHLNIQITGLGGKREIKECTQPRPRGAGKEKKVEADNAGREEDRTGKQRERTKKENEMKDTAES